MARCDCTGANKSGEGSRADLLLDFCGVAKGLERDSASEDPVSLCFPLFFCGENGLNDDRGAVGSMARAFVALRDEVLGFDGGGLEEEARESEEPAANLLSFL